MNENSVLCGRYRLQQPIGRGGMADVYLAFDSKRQARRPGQAAARGTSRKTLTSSGASAARARRWQASITPISSASTRSSRTARLRSSSWTTSTAPRSGAGCRTSGATLGLDEITPILRDICGALYYAHLNGFVHRDLKPGNVMLKRDGTALLTDFGISRNRGRDADRRGDGHAHVHQPPADHRRAGRRALRHLQPGRRAVRDGDGTAAVQRGGAGAFRVGHDDRVQQAHLHLPPPDPRSLNPRLPAAAGAVILRALAKDPGDRFPDVVSLARPGMRLLALPGLPLPRGSLRPPLRRSRPRRLCRQIALSGAAAGQALFRSVASRSRHDHGDRSGGRGSALTAAEPAGACGTRGCAAHRAGAGPGQPDGHFSTADGRTARGRAGGDAGGVTCSGARAATAKADGATAAPTVAPAPSHTPEPTPTPTMRPAAAARQGRRRRRTQADSQGFVRVSLKAVSNDTTSNGYVSPPSGDAVLSGVPFSLGTGESVTTQAAPLPDNPKSISLAVDVDRPAAVYLLLTGGDLYGNFAGASWAKSF